MSKLFVANFKDQMNKTAAMKYAEYLKSFDGTFNNRIALLLDDKSAISVKAKLCSTGFLVGIQDYNKTACQEVDMVLLGHSMKRRIGETNQDVNSKLKEVLRLNKTALVCLSGDSVEEYREEISQDLETIFNGVSSFENIIIAYEPVFAIGTGNSMDTGLINEIINFIKGQLKTITKVKVPVLYGGSVNLDNYKDILKIKSLDGLLIGKASLDKRAFVKICGVKNFPSLDKGC